MTGQAPFHGDSITEVVAKVLQATEPPSAAQLRADLPRAFAAALGRSLEKERERRYANVAAFATAIAPFRAARSELAVERIARALGSGQRVPLELQATQNQPAQAASGPQRESIPKPSAGGTTSKAVWSEGGRGGEPAKAPPRRRPGTVAVVLAIVGTATAVGVVVSLTKPGPWHSKGAASGGLDIPEVSARPEVEDEFRRGIEAYLGADIEGAERAFKQVEADEPREPWPKLGLALTFAIEQRFDESSAAEAAALDLARTEPTVAPRDRQLLELLDAWNAAAQAGPRPGQDATGAVDADRALRDRRRRDGQDGRRARDVRYRRSPRPRAFIASWSPSSPGGFACARVRPSGKRPPSQASSCAFVQPTWPGGRRSETMTMRWPRRATAGSSE